MKPVKYEIRITASIETGDFRTKEEAFGTLGKFIDEFVVLGYGGIVSSVECVAKDYKQTDGPTIVMVDKVIATVTSNGVRWMDVLEVPDEGLI